MRPASLLTRSDLFGFLPVEEVDKLSRFSREREFAAHEWILHRDERAADLFLVLDGAVQLRLPAHKGESAIILHTIEPGTFVGLSALLEGARYTASAMAATPSTLLVIEGKPLRRLISVNPRLGQEILATVARGYADRYAQVLTRFQGVVNQLPLLCMAVRGPRAGCG